MATMEAKIDFILQESHPIDTWDDSQHVLDTIFTCIDSNNGNAAPQLHLLLAHLISPSTNTTTTTSSTSSSSSWLFPSTNSKQTHTLIGVFDGCMDRLLLHETVVALPDSLWQEIKQQLGLWHVNGKHSNTRALAAVVLTKAFQTRIPPTNTTATTVTTPVTSSTQPNTTTATLSLAHADGVALLDIFCTRSNGATTCLDLPKRSNFNQFYNLLLQVLQEVGQALTAERRATVLTVLFELEQTNETHNTAVVACLCEMYGHGKSSNTMVNDILSLASSNTDASTTTDPMMGALAFRTLGRVWSFCATLKHDWASFASASGNQNFLYQVGTAMGTWLSQQLHHQFNTTTTTCQESINTYTQQTSKWMTAYRKACFVLGQHTATTATTATTSTTATTAATATSTSTCLPWFTPWLHTTPLLDRSSEDDQQWVDCNRLSTGLTLSSLLQGCRRGGSKEMCFTPTAVPPLIKVILYQCVLLRQEESDTSRVVANVWESTLKHVLLLLRPTKTDTNEQKNETPHSNEIDHKYIKLFQWAEKSTQKKRKSSTPPQQQKSDRVPSVQLMLHCANMMASAAASIEATPPTTSPHQTATTILHLLSTTLRPTTTKRVSSSSSNAAASSAITAMVAETVDLWVSLFGKNKSSTPNALKTSSILHQQFTWCVTHLVRPCMDTTMVGRLLPLICPLVEDYTSEMQVLGLQLLAHVLQETNPTAYRSHELLITDIVQKTFVMHNNDLLVLNESLRCVLYCAVLARRGASSHGGTGGSNSGASTATAAAITPAEQKKRHAPLDNCISTGNTNILFSFVSIVLHLLVYSLLFFVCCFVV